MPSHKKNLTPQDRLRTEALRACMTAAWRIAGTQTDLAHLAGVRQRTISRFCDGKSRPLWLDAHKVWQGVRRKVGQIPPVEDLVESLAAMKPPDQVEAELHFLAMVTEATRRVLQAGRAGGAVPITAPKGQTQPDPEPAAGPGLTVARLKLCPHCRSARLSHSNLLARARVECNSCGMNGPTFLFDDWKSAERAWNRLPR